MAIADTINSIRTHLTADYESLENIGAELENVDKNIENIASVVNEIYDNIPKTTGEDTNLSLTTLKGKMNIIPKGNTEQDGTPTPDTPIDVEVVTGTQEVKVENVNLLKDLRPSTQTLNGITFTNNGNGTFKINGTSSAYTQFIDSDSFTLAKGTYTLSGRSTSVSGATMQLRSPDGYTIITQTNSKVAFTLSESTEVKFRIVMTASNTFSNAEFEPMILSGDVTQNIPTYTPHQEQTQTISLGDIELCKIGTAQDYLYKSNGKWYKKEYIGKTIFNGSETISAVETSKTNTTRVAYWGILANSPAIPYSTTYKGFSNYFTIENVWDTDSEGLYANRDAIVFRVAKTIGTSTSEIATWLSTHNTEVYYVLATPNDIEITNETLIEQLNNLEKLKSYNGVTNINCSGNLSAILSVSALKGE